MARRDGEMSTGQAARALGLDIKTVRRWAHLTIDGLNTPLLVVVVDDAEEAAIPPVRMDLVGHLWIRRARVRALQAQRTDNTDRTDRTDRTTGTDSA